MEDFAHKQQVKHTSTAIEPSIALHILGKFVDAESITIEQVRSLDLPL